MDINRFAPNSLFFLLCGAWGKMAINCFVLITGYFMCKSHITVKKLIKLLLQVEFYNVAIYLIFLVTGYSNFSLRSFFEALIPVRVIGNDFTPAFIAFYLCIPFLNKLIHNLNKKMHFRLIVLSVFIYTFFGTMPLFSVTMNYLSWFVVLFFISSFVRIYPYALFDNTKLWGIFSICSVTISVVSIIAFLRIDGWYFLMDSNKVLAIVTAFCLFMLFKNIRIKYIGFINLIASATFGVLLIHSNSATMRYWLWSDVLHTKAVFDTSWCYLHFFLSVISIYVACTCIDLLRIHIIEKPFFNMYNRFAPRAFNKIMVIDEIVLRKLHID